MTSAELEIGALVDAGNGPQVVVYINRNLEIVRLAPADWNLRTEFDWSQVSSDLPFESLKAVA